MFENVKVGDEVAIMSSGCRDAPRKAVVTAVTKTQFRAGEHRYLRSDGRGYGDPTGRFWAEPWTDEHQKQLDQYVRRRKERKLCHAIMVCIEAMPLEVLEQTVKVLQEADLMRYWNGQCRS